MTSTTRCFIGCDPGPTTGIAVAYWDEDSWLHPQAYQCDAASAPGLLAWLLGENKALPGLAQVEEFRAGTGAGARGANAGVTRAGVHGLTDVLDEAGVRYEVRPAAAVKPWATDKRLEKAGLLAVTSGMPDHARDAFRHLLYTACHDAGIPDPLSRRRKP